VLLAVLTALLLGTYSVPFLGIFLSLLLPVVTHRYRRLLWPAVVRRTSIIVSLLAWLGLWWPALVYFLTGFSLMASVEQSTAWLLIPLCGPVAPGATIGPATGAALVGLLGLVVAVGWRRPWPWIAGAWAAPWVHQVVLLSLPNHEFVC